MDALYKAMYSLQSENKSFAVATIVKSKGSAPRHSAKMIVTSDKSIFGTIGGGPLEHYVIEESIKAILEKESTMLYYRLDKNSNKASLYTDNKNIEQIDMLCGGDVDIFIEFVPSSRNVYLIGSGHVNIALAHILNFLGFNYFVVTTTDSHLNKNKFINANFILGDTFTSAIRGINFCEDDIVIIATFNNDEESLRELIKKDLAFLGMIGSRKKVHIIKEKLLNDGTATLGDMESLHAPLGLDLGGESPRDIAISIISLVMMSVNNASGESKSRGNKKNNDTIVVRGGGDIATGVVLALKKVGFNIIVLEKENPTVIRRYVSIANAVYDSNFEVEGIKGVLVKTFEEALALSKEKNTVPILIDATMSSLTRIKPFALIDATISKKNMGLTKNLAPLVVALSSGFNAGVDCHYVIETMRGHDLARIIYEGHALENTGVPARVMGASEERLLKSPCKGIFNIKKDIGTIVYKNDDLATVTDVDGIVHIIKAKIDGVVRGMLKDGLHVDGYFKVGDIDPRGESSYAFSVSEKSRSLGGAVLLAILEHKNNYPERDTVRQ